MKTYEQYIEQKIEQEKILFKTNELSYCRNIVEGRYDDEPSAKLTAQNSLHNHQRLINDLVQILLSERGLK